MENQNQQQSQIQQITWQNSEEISKRLNERITKDGECRVSDLIGELVSAKDVTECVALLTAAYGKDYAHEMQERVQLLFSIIREENWTRERFIKTTRWIIVNRPYRDWTIFDWINAPLAKLYPYSKYLSELHEKGKGFNAEIQWYDINGIQLWAYKREGELPFPKAEKVSPVNNTPPMDLTDEPFDYSEFAKAFLTRPIQEEKRIGGKSLTELLPNV